MKRIPFIALILFGTTSFLLGSLVEAAPLRLSAFITRIEAVLEGQTLDRILTWAFVKGKADEPTWKALVKILEKADPESIEQFDWELTRLGEDVRLLLNQEQRETFILGKRVEEASPFSMQDADRMTGGAFVLGKRLEGPNPFLVENASRMTLEQRVASIAHLQSIVQARLQFVGRLVIKVATMDTLPHDFRSGVVRTYLEHLMRWAEARPASWSVPEQAVEVVALPLDSHIERIYKAAVETVTGGQLSTPLADQAYLMAEFGPNYTSVYATTWHRILLDTRRSNVLADPQVLELFPGHTSNSDSARDVQGFWNLTREAGWLLPSAGRLRTEFDTAMRIVESLGEREPFDSHLWLAALEEIKRVYGVNEVVAEELASTLVSKLNPNAREQLGDARFKVDMVDGLVDLIEEGNTTALLHLTDQHADLIGGDDVERIVRGIRSHSERVGSDFVLVNRNPTADGSEFIAEIIRRIAE